MTHERIQNTIMREIWEAIEELNLKEYDDVELREFVLS